MVEEITIDSNKKSETPLKVEFIKIEQERKAVEDLSELIFQLLKPNLALTNVLVKVLKKIDAYEKELQK